MINIIFQNFLNVQAHNNFDLPRANQLFWASVENCNRVFGQNDAKSVKIVKTSSPQCIIFKSVKLYRNVVRKFQV